ncbi:MAG: aspartate-semialdehyde dehydrogenase [Phycisphaeraceae bacterium]
MHTFNNPPHLAVAGVTGAVGQEFLAILEQRNFPFGKLKLLASARSAGKQITFKSKTYTVEELTEASFKDIDIALFSAGGSISKKFAPIAAAAGCAVVDNSSAFRMDPAVPLVVPEVNPQDIALHKGIIANPNCSTIIMNVPVWPLHKVNPVKRAVVSTYQAASGAGAAAMAELEQQARDWSAGRPLKTDIFKRQYIFNLFSHNSKIDPATGYNEEETKMLNETRKIFHCPDFTVTTTCVRVPVLRAHCEAVNLQFEKPMTEQLVRDILAAAPGIKIVDDREINQHPEPLAASGQDDVLVGRIRQDWSLPNNTGIDLFISGDQIRKGAALNAVQIAELLLK